jgi:hypothetical protein
MGGVTDLVDTSVVELHRLTPGPHVVDEVHGSAFHVIEEGDTYLELSSGNTLKIGDTIVVDPGARVVIGGVLLEGGRRGRAHTFVAENAFRSSPNKDDVPKLLDQLSEIEEKMRANLGEDPLHMHRAPLTEPDRAVAAEFARQNLVVPIARELPETVARRWRCVCLFYCDEAAFLATSDVSIAKLRAVMQALGRPVNPHLVEEAIVEELLARVYGSPPSPNAPS